MDKWVFNIELFSGLTDVLDLSASKISRKTGISQQTMSRYVTHEIGISVQNLLQICNALRMPAYYFVVENGISHYPQREEATITPELWKDVEWDADAVERTFGGSASQIHWKDVSRAMGVSEQKSHGRFLLQTRFPIDDFFKTCTNLQVSPFRFLVDLNRPGHKRNDKKLECGDKKKDGRLSAENKQIKELRNEIAELREKLAELSGNYKTLLAAHNTLARRVSVNIDTVRDSYVAIAADPDV